MDFGNGPSLKEVYFSDTNLRFNKIIQVVEINSIMEGLPPLDSLTKRIIYANLCNQRHTSLGFNRVLKTKSP